MSTSSRDRFARPTPIGRCHERAVELRADRITSAQSHRRWCGLCADAAMQRRLKRIGRDKG
jgi:hypothetical protein